MNKVYSSNFLKRFKVLPPKIKHQFYKRLDLFLSDSIHPILKNHTLKGDMLGYRSFSITGDYRAIYRFEDRETIIFTNIGRHSQVY